jgi:hypothetical protein
MSQAAKLLFDPFCLSSQFVSSASFWLKIVLSGTSLALLKLAFLRENPRHSFSLSSFLKMHSHGLTVFISSIFSNIHLVLNKNRPVKSRNNLCSGRPAHLLKHSA